MNMKAIINTQYGSPDVLRYEEVDTPIPKDDEVLIKIHYAAANAGDLHLLRADPFLIRLMMGFFKPKIQILGFDVSGTIQQVGKHVKKFKKGDEVFGDISESGFGAYAQFVSVPESSLVKKPKKISFEQAAGVSGAGMTALQGLVKHGHIKAGQNVLIVGASGGVGHFAVQLAKSYGAVVTGVCSTKNVKMVKSIGANFVVDYKKEDVTKNGIKYDLIVDAAAFRSIKDYKNSLTAKGKYILVGGSMKQLMQIMILGPIMSKKNGIEFRNFLVKPNQKDLLLLRDLLEKGKLKTIVDKRFPLEKVPDAIRYMEKERACGKIIIKIE
jgi:2-desacetyl-2-hydroxyethyl bacteriochlorophyllide A dehydrogenase